MFYDQLMIDEFQDFREYDYDLITALSQYVNNILLVGDYYQHSVSAINNSGKPFKKNSKIVGYDEFIGPRWVFLQLQVAQQFAPFLKNKKCRTICSIARHSNV